MKKSNGVKWNLWKVSTKEMHFEELYLSGNVFGISILKKRSLIKGATGGLHVDTA
jgi:hypothetical protein